jgi:aspartyl-tRNA(Asn)/glutamyl-tRNA(Gln) amidotransferase subunit A
VTQELARASLTATSALLQADDVSPTEVLNAVLERAYELNPHLNAFVTILEEPARRHVAELESQPRSARQGKPLWGIPISIKDNISVAGAVTTAGSRVPLGDRFTDDAAVTGLVRAAGAVVFAKTSLYEFAFGAPNPAYPPTRNPWSPTRSTAGSSSGSVAAVSASIGYGSIGTDTGGSIRVPAAMCGIVGLKPTFGRVPTDGVVPVSWSLDHVGPIARTVADARAMLEAVGGPPRAHNSKPTRIGIAIDMPALDPHVRSALVDAADVLARTHDVVDVALPDMDVARTVLWTIASAEASDYHRHLLERHGAVYAPIVRRRLLRGRLLPASDYVRAQRLRTTLTAELERLTDGVDAVVLPVSPVPAYALDDRRVHVGDSVQDASDAVTRFTPLFSLSGWPAVSVPCGMTGDGLPVGLQVVARAGCDEAALAVAEAYERATPWHRLQPPDPSASA